MSLQKIISQLSQAFVEQQKPSSTTTSLTGIPLGPDISLELNNAIECTRRSLLSNGNFPALEGRPVVHWPPRQMNGEPLPAPAISMSAAPALMSSMLPMDGATVIGASLPSTTTSETLPVDLDAFSRRRFGGHLGEPFVRTEKKRRRGGFDQDESKNRSYRPKSSPAIDRRDMPSLLDVQTGLAEDHSQILDFRVRIPNQEVRQDPLLAVLGEILQQVREINAKLPQRPPERPVERKFERRRSDIAAEAAIFEYELPADRKALALRAYIPTHFQEIRSVVEEVIGPLISQSSRSCRVCHMPYSIQRNKDVLEFRCRNAKEHDTSVYGGRIPDHVLEAAWDVIQERGLENLNFMVRHRRVSRDEDQLMAPAGETDGRTPGEPTKADYALLEMSDSVDPSPGVPEASGDVRCDLRSDPGDTDVRLVGMEVVARMLPREQRTCKVCGDLYTLNRNKGSLEFRCRNNALHQQSLYGGRVPKDVMDQIYEVIRQRRGEAASDSSFSATSSKKRKVGDEEKKLPNGTHDVKTEDVTANVLWLPQFYEELTSQEEETMPAVSSSPREVPPP